MARIRVLSALNFLVMAAMPCVALAGTVFTLTPASTAHGTISPAAPFAVNSGQSATLTVVPDANFVAIVGGTCGGSLSGSTYTTAAISANCTVVAAFSDGIFFGGFDTANVATYTVIFPIGDSMAGQSYPVKAAVVAAVGQPDGSMSVIDDANPADVCGPATLSAGSASCNIAAAAVGTYRLTSVYAPGPGSLYRASDSAATAHIVDKGPAPTSLVTSISPSLVGQSVTFTATLSSGAGTATGTVSFKDGTTSIASACDTAAVSAHIATCTTGALSQGSHTITASYSGDVNFLPSSNSLAQVVLGATTTTIALNQFVAGAQVLASVTVVGNASAGPPTGTVAVTVSPGSPSFFGSCTLAPTGIAQAGCMIAAGETPGSQTFTPTYGGDAQYAASTGFQIFDVQ